jgi:hypothetical protein
VAPGANASASAGDATKAEPPVAPAATTLTSIPFARATATGATPMASTSRVPEASAWMALGPESNFVVLMSSPASFAQPAPSSTNSALAPITGT